MKPNKNSAAKARKLAAQLRAVELRRSGLTYRAIGAELGCSGAAAHGYVADGLAETIAHIESASIEIKAEEVSRLDGLLAGLWVKASNGDLGAVDRVLKIMERRAKLLGLDAPAKIAPTTPSGEQPYVDASRLSSAALAEIMAAIDESGQR